MVVFIVWIVFILLTKNKLESHYGYKNNLENSSATKVGEHISSDFSISIILSFKAQKITMMCMEVKTVWKSFANP